MSNGAPPPPPSRLLTDLLTRLGRFALFVGQVIVSMLRPPFYFDQVLESAARVGSRCVIPVVLVLAPFGMVISLHGTQVFRMFGAERMLGLLVGIATFRELAPNLAAILIAAQAGAAFAAELAAMRVQEEIDATRIMGIDPLKYHVAPRILGMILASPLLAVVGCAAGVLGGYVMAILVNGQNGGAFLDNLYTNLSLFDLWSSMFKAGVFGALIGCLGCYYGYYAEGGAQGVGEAVNRTVVYSVTFFLVVNYFLSTALFGIVE